MPTRVTLPNGRIILEDNGVISDGGHSFGYVVDVKPDLQVGQVEEHLFVASQDVADDLALINKYGITHVLNVSGIPNQTLKPGVNYCNVCILDLPEEQLSSHFPECFQFLDAGVREGSVLVHCNAGISRSVSIVVAYLMSRREKSLAEALDIVRTARPRAKPNEGFLKQLELFEKMCSQVK